MDRYFSQNTYANAFILCITCHLVAVAAKTAPEMRQMIESRTHTDETGPSVYVIVCGKCESSYTHPGDIPECCDLDELYALDEYKMICVYVGRKPYNHI